MATDADQQSRTAAVYGGTVSLVILATFAVALRLYARSTTKARFWWDDWVLILALVFDYGLSICYWLQVIYGGLGRHTTTVGGPVTEHQILIYLKVFLPLQLFYFTSAFTVKTSLILLYYRIFAVVRWFRWSLIAAGLIVVLNFIVDFFVAIFQCKPIDYLWDKSTPKGTCINQNQFYRWNGVANLLIDFMILTLTMPMIWNMRLQMRQKLSLTGLFLLGTFACAASIIRVITFNQVNFEDISYTMVNVSIWSTIEQSIGIICACLITYRPLFSRMLSAYSNSRTTENAAASQGANNSRSVEMSNRRSNAPPRMVSDASTAGFARLYEEADGLERGIKKSPRVTTSIRTPGLSSHPQGEEESDG